MTTHTRTPSLIHLHILLALADGDCHGYGIKQEVERHTEGAVRLGPGTLYEAIQRLEQTGLIAEVDPPEQDDDRPRRFYRLTKRGWRVLREEMDRLQRLLDHAQAKPRLRKAGSR
jgi:DNA-binding PadR family transcriptional regulator